MNPKIKNLLIRTLTGAIYVSMMVISIYNPWVLTGLFLLVIGIGMHESANLALQPVDTLTRISWITIGCLLFLLIWLMQYPFDFMSEQWPSSFFPFGLYLFWTAIVVIILYFIGLDVFRFHQLAATGILNIFWMVIPLLIIATNTLSRPSTVLAFFLFIWASDTFAYLGGSLLGKHKLCERVSPGKTWEGFLISLVLTICLAVLLSRIPYFNQGGFYGNVLIWIGFAAIVVVFGLLGDLFESLLKRKAGVKDSGKLIPGHGGVLDRFDSIFVAAYPAFLYVTLF